jgi:hypothetical protein
MFCTVISGPLRPGFPKTDVTEETQDIKGAGRFGWVTEPEGNRVELWQAT